MIHRSAGAFAVFALAAGFGCMPAEHGRCSQASDCRQGASCSLDGICLSGSGTCAPSCGDGYLCSGGVCAPLLPAVSVAPPAGPVSPALSQLPVQIHAPATVALRSLSLEVSGAAGSLASGTLEAPQEGDNLVALTRFTLGVTSASSVRATLVYRPSGAAADAKVSSPAVPATFDSAAPAVSVFVPEDGSVNGVSLDGWYPRAGPDLEVRATVDDGTGTGAQAATLSFDACPAAVPCAYAGKAVSQAGTATVFSFTVPRAAQPAGSEAPLAVTVRATDAAGNLGQGAGTLKIDGAPPQMGPVTVITPGVVGEDGSTWYPGGAPGTDVTISVPVSDLGAGLKSVSLALNAQDLAPNTPPDPVAEFQPDGKAVRFVLPASAVVGKELPLRFTLAAKDRFDQAASMSSSINVDSLPPTVSAARVDYNGATPALPLVCNDLEGAAFNCGRQPVNGTFTHLLPDDTATVTFTLVDCGSGITSRPQPDAVTNAGPNTFAVTRSTGPGTRTCASNGNRTYQYSFTLPVSQLALPPPDANGTSLVQLTALGVDAAGNAGASKANTGTSGDGLALVSTWRWRRSLSGATRVTGGPALLPALAGAARQIAVGTDAARPIFLVNADGSLPAISNPAITAPAANDLAVSETRVVYAVSGTANGQLSMVLSDGTPVMCASATGATFAAPPVIAQLSSPGGEFATVLSTSRTGPLVPFLSQYQIVANSCTLAHAITLSSTGNFTGATGTLSRVFVSGSQGFTSYDFAGASQSYQTAAALALAPPALLGGGANPLFADSTAHVLRLTAAPAAAGSCGLGILSCWQDSPPAFDPAAGNLTGTPVSDGAAAWVVNDAGVLYRFSMAGKLDPAAGVTLPAPASPPVLLGASPSSALLVQGDGQVVLVSPSGARSSLVQVTAPVAFPPAVDARGGQGVAYVVTAGQKALWAVQTPLPPLTASATNWPRPGHDSCNSRNLNTDPTRCP